MCFHSSWNSCHCLFSIPSICLHIFYHFYLFHFQKSWKLFMSHLWANTLNTILISYQEFGIRFCWNIGGNLGREIQWNNDKVIIHHERKKNVKPIQYIFNQQIGVNDILLNKLYSCEFIRSFDCNKSYDVEHTYENLWWMNEKDRSLTTEN